ncbi:putative transmembrane protein [Cedratvirus kamchatka]|uniref:Transmembrane protein n=1 Tax=Cedratvirus kamchatka TaxID=2716914 RepID=A0A6G8MZ18_9VIRU|nr:putative transmembrane protein [Cedratvirus kamchatka]
MSKAVPEAVIVSSPTPVSDVVKPQANTISTTTLINKDTFTTKRVMGLVLVLSLLGLGIAWIALSVAGLPGWINIVLIIVALLMIVVIGWLFFSP